MFEVRIHGRGGQGVVTAAELLALAAFDEGRWAQAFPSFGSERMGAPVVSFCRIDDHEIRTREPVVAPDALIVQDATLLHQVNVFDGCSGDAYVLINSIRGFDELGVGELARRLRHERLLTVPAMSLARQYAGATAAVNVALLASFAALTGVVSLDAVERAIAERFSEKLVAGNLATARAAHAWTSAQIVQVRGAA